MNMLFRYPGSGVLHPDALICSHPRFVSAEDQTPSCDFGNQKRADTLAQKLRHQPTFKRLCGGFGARGDSKFAIDIADIAADRC